MISYRTALDLIDQNIKTNNTELRSLYEIYGYVNAEGIYSNDNIPGNDNSAMDGFAIKYEDVLSATIENPVKLKIAGVIPAGKPTENILKNGEVYSIMTGAVIPDGADSVIRQEDVDEQDGYVLINSTLKIGNNIRKAGEDIAKGAKVLLKGKKINYADAGILASIGMSEVKVYKKPTVSIFVTGDELVEPNEKLTKGKVRNSNLYTLYNMLLKFGIVPKIVEKGSDSLEDVKNKIQNNMDSDILITTGAVSVGKFDFIKDALDDLGFERVFWRVAQKPGKPLLFGKLKNTLIFGLPGNPVSAAVSFKVYVETAIKKIMGYEDYFPEILTGELSENISKNIKLTHFVAGKIKIENGRIKINQLPKQGSGILSKMSISDCLLVLPEGRDDFNKNEIVEYIPVN